MDLINKYRCGAYRKFECECVWININKEKQKVSSYLDSKQKGQSQYHRFYVSDIETVLSEKEFDKPMEGFTLKTAIQKANFDVKRSTVNNGYTTRLLFLTKDNYNERDWYLYGYAKGLYNNMSLLNISKSNPLGWSLYISLMENDVNLSGGIPQFHKLKKLLEKIKANN